MCESITCIQCGKSFERNPMGRIRQFCPDCRPPQRTKPFEARICPYCGDEFIPHNGKQKYCSYICGCRHRDGSKPFEPGATIKSQCPFCGVHFTHPAYRQKKYCSVQCYRFDSRQPRPNARTLLDRPCLVCGKMFRPKRDSAKYCSKECMTFAYQVNALDTARFHTCEFCGKEFQHRRRASRDSNRYCSRECASLSQVGRQSPLRKHPQHCKTCGVILPKQFIGKRDECMDCSPPTVYVIECVVCGAIFQSRRQQKQARFCSQVCTQQYARAEGRRPGLPATSYRQCVVCGEWFATRRRGKKTCSDECALENLKQSKRQGHNRYTKRSYTNWITTERRVRIYQRDNYVCHICGEPTNPYAHYLSDWYPSLDHLVPRNDGGDNSDDNLACCHRLCNAVKRDKSVEHARTELGVVLQEV